MPNHTNSAIRFNEVNFNADGVHIIKNISGSIMKGKITTLIGPSGAGKSTLFRMCNGLISPSSGEIYLNEEPIQSYDPVNLRRNVGYALQDATMLGGTVRENLALPRILNGKTLPDDEAEELMQLVGLEKDFLRKKAKDLSGGQRQKLSIARTLVNRPDILLLDEITSSLDRISTQDIEELIQKINDKYKVTIIWITHNLEQAITIGNHTWVLMDGELMESGESDFLNNPTNDDVKRFVSGEVQ
ncbi:phosphate ABC transporter ATP-binding protein [Virgibacillus oceani]